MPAVGDKRTSVYLETVRRLRALSNTLLVLGGCIGPFSLAARLTGVTVSRSETDREPFAFV